MSCILHVYTVCVGGTAFLVFALVKLARTPHSRGGIIVVSIFLLLWLGFCASIYPELCGAFFPWSALGRCLEPPLSAVRWLICLPSRCAWRHRRSDDGTGALPQFVVQSHGYSISTLPREPPLRGGTPVGARATAAGIPAYEQPDDAARPDGASDCAVCLGKVEKGEMLECVWAVELAGDEYVRLQGPRGQYLGADDPATPSCRVVQGLPSTPNDSAFLWTPCREEGEPGARCLTLSGPLGRLLRASLGETPRDNAVGPEESTWVVEAVPAEPRPVLRRRLQATAATSGTAGVQRLRRQALLRQGIRTEA
ncbi:hypothetical protein BAE44_0008477 [Dichanthelium oligosanthes]|uniref:DUF569 domain-containing protein n=1 Tax=Dichanthelium oligosanthes TaxID=888268 RepID=A0A1E5VZG6_9POAL|nr:hypothetical protein BAE44_0008477 [Dichanthelium oligosanthes]